MTKAFRSIFPVTFMLLVITAFHYTRCELLKFYPVVANFTFFSLFFTTSFMKETLTQRLAKLVDPVLNEKAKDYTRKLNYAWACFTFCNFVISLITVFLPEKIWAIYNGFISYLLVGTFFVIEFFVRRNVKRKHGC